MLSALEDSQIQTSRSGAGKGVERTEDISRDIMFKRKFKEYFNDAELVELLASVKTQAKVNPAMLKFCLEQIFGRAPQREKDSNDEQARMQMARIEDYMKKFF